MKMTKIVNGIPVEMTSSESIDFDLKRPSVFVDGKVQEKKDRIDALIDTLVFNGALSSDDAETLKAQR